MMNASIYNESCLTALDKIPPRSVNLIVAEPPVSSVSTRWQEKVPMGEYVVWENAMYEYDNFMKLMYLCGVNYLTAQIYWDDNYLEGVWSKYRRILAPNGVVVLLSSGESTLRFVSKPSIPWRYNLTAKLSLKSGNKAIQKSTDIDICVFSPHLTEYRNDMSAYYNALPVLTDNGTKCIGLGGAAPAVVKFYYDRLYSLANPQKPDEMYNFIVSAFSGEGETVMDNCMTNLSVYKAAISAGRGFIGMSEDKTLVERAHL